MLYCDRIDVSEGIGINKTSVSKECDICHYWYFSNKVFKFQTYVCNRYHDLLMIFFSIWVFYHDHSRITGLQGKGEGISLTSRYHFHPLHRHLDISRMITTESSPLHIANSRTRTGNLWFPSASC